MCNLFQVPGLTRASTTKQNVFPCATGIILIRTYLDTAILSFAKCGKAKRTLPGHKLFDNLIQTVNVHVHNLPSKRGMLLSAVTHRL
jgi:hypothetical protein